MNLLDWCIENKKQNLLDEWDDYENSPLAPTDVMYASNKMCAWKCEKGHCFWQSPNQRTLRRQNCPYCSNQKVLEGFNDLASINLKLALQWNYEKKNNNPSEVTAHSRKKVWWKCDKGHTWEAAISDRACGDGCPYCSGKRVLEGYNDLATTNPALALEWDYEKNGAVLPTMVSAGSGKKYWWLCRKGHSFDATVNNRTGGKNCPYCSNKKVLPGYNDLEKWCKDNHQEQLLNDWNWSRNAGRPTDYVATSHKKIYWKCQFCGDEWIASISVRTRNIDVFGCRRCAVKNSKERLNQKIIDAGNKLKYLYPDLYRKCPVCGKEWLVSINKKTKNGAICSNCSIKEAKEKKNTDDIAVRGSLLLIHPEIAKEWNYDKNEKLTPDRVLSSSSKKVWWICPKGHSYQSVIGRRTGQKSGCPYCSNKMVLPGFNDFETWCKQNNCLDLLDEWDYERNDKRPADVIPFGHDRIWWKCKECGYEWNTILSSRAGGTGCPRCAKEMQTSFPEQAIYFYVKKFFSDAINGDYHLGKELDIFIPSLNVAIEYDGQMWHKKINRDIDKNRLCEKEGIKLFRIREMGCPELKDTDYCKVISVHEYNMDDLNNAIAIFLSNVGIFENIDVERDRTFIYAQYIKKIKSNSLAVTHPELLKIWDYNKNRGLKPNHISYGSKKKVWWMCPNGHSYSASISSRVNGIGCPICSGRIIISGDNDFSTWCKTHEKEYLLDEWDYEKNVLKPTEIPKSPKDKFWWICARGHSYESYTYNRIKGSGCPVCAGKRIIKGENDLTKTNPELIKEWDYDLNIKGPSDYTRGSNKKVHWICKTGHHYEASICDRTRGRGCPYCSGKKVLKGVNDLTTTHADLMMDWDYSKNEIDPTKLSSGSNKRVFWKCHICGGEWATAIFNRTKHNSGCPNCGKNRIH